MSAGESVPHFGQTNVSQPQVHHASDTQSVTASEDYFSLTSSNNSSDDARIALPPPTKRYQIPPARYRVSSTDEAGNVKPEQAAAAPRVPMRGEGRRRLSDPTTNDPLQSTLQTSPRQGFINRKPVPSTVYEVRPGETIQPSMSSAARDDPPTPGADDGPFIRFALDQLTRDEEVRGSRAYPGQAQVSTGSEPSTGLSQHPVDTRRLPRDTYGAPADIHRVTDGSYRPLASTDGSPANTNAVPRSNKATAEPMDLPADNKERSSRGPLPASMIRKGRTDTNTIDRSPERFLAIDGPSAIPFMKLNSLPIILKALPAFIGALALLLAALIIAAAWSVNERLWEYGTLGDGRYFIFQYLPTLLAVLLLVWLHEIQKALLRIAPFIALSSGCPRISSRASLLPLYPSSLAWPQLSHFSAGFPAIGTFLVSSWLSLFCVPLLATSFNVYQTNGTFTWLATQGVIWVVIALYIVLISSAIWLAIFLRQHSSGLRWDPVSLADLLVLFERSNVLDDYTLYYTSHSDHDFRKNVLARGDRIGYWRTSIRPNAAIHTVGAPGQSARRYSEQDGELIEQPSPRLSTNADLDCQRYSAQTTKGLISDRGADSSLYIPTILSPVVALGLGAVFLLLLAAFFVASYLPATAVESGFDPSLPFLIDTRGFSATNFVYSFIPSLLGLLLSLLIIHQDLTLRRLQFIANLRGPHGASADRSILQTYMSSPPILVTLRALRNRDWRVAISSILALLSLGLPVLAGGVFWAQFSISSQSTRMYVDTPAYVALGVLVALSCSAFLVLPFTRKQSAAYAVPTPCVVANGAAGLRKKNQARTLVDMVSLFHQSRLLTDSAFRAPASRTQLVTRLLAGQTQSGVARGSVLGGSSTPGHEREKGTPVHEEAGRFAMGRFRGRNGREWIGVDRLERMLDGREGREDV